MRGEEKLSSARSHFTKSCLSWPFLLGQSENISGAPYLCVYKCVWAFWSSVLGIEYVEEILMYQHTHTHTHMAKHTLVKEINCKQVQGSLSKSVKIYRYIFSFKPNKGCGKAVEIQIWTFIINVEK